MPDRPAAAFARRRSVPATPKPAAAPRPAPAPGFAEKVYSLIAAGRLQLLPYLDPYTEETPQMVRMYPVMMRHGVVKQALLTKVHSVTSLDLKTVPASSSSRDREVASFIRYAYTTALEGRFITLGEEILLPALITKISICEKVWYDELWQRGDWRGKQLLRCVKAKEHTDPLYDEFRNIEQVKAWGSGNANRGPWPAGDFVVYKNLPLYQGAGMSDLRSAYKHLWELDTVEKLHAIYLDLYGKPKVHATYGEAFDTAKDSGGNSPLTALEGDLSNLGVRGWILTPESVKLEALSLASQSQADHLAFCKDRREQIAISIDAAFLHMMTAHQARGEMRGDSQSQSRNKDLLVWALAEKLCAVLDSQLTPDLVNRNYYEADYPSLSLGGIDFAALKAGMDVAAAAQKMGFNLSKKAMARDFNLQEAETPEDTLRAPAPAPPPGGGFQFSDRPRSRRKRKPRPGDDDLWEFCGGKGSGKPGPCPTGEKATPHDPDAGERRARWGKAAAELVAANPPPPQPQRDIFTTPGLGNPKMVAESPHLQEVLRRRDEHTAAQFDNGNAMFVHEMLARPAQRPVALPPEGEPERRTVARAKLALSRAQEDLHVHGSLSIPTFRDRLAASHPEGPALVEAARAEAMRRYSVSRGRAAEIVARIPEGVQKQRATRALAKLPAADGTQRHSDRLDFCGGPGSGVPGPCPSGRSDDRSGGDKGGAGKSVERGDEISASYVDSFNENPSAITQADVEAANSEIETDESEYRLVPTEDGEGWQAMHVDDVEEQYGDNWVVTRDPKTGQWQAGDQDYFDQETQELADDPEKWAAAFNDRDVHADEIKNANEVLAGTEDRLIPQGAEGWTVMSAEDVADQYGENWGIYQDPETGQWDTGDVEGIRHLGAKNVLE